MKRVFLLFLFFTFLLVCISNSPAPLQSPPASQAGISMTVDPKWIPTKNNTCEITVSITDSVPNNHLTFQLISTNWPGYCMNAFDKSPDPATGQPRTSPKRTPDKDLQFLVASQVTSVTIDVVKNGQTVAETIRLTWTASADGSAITVSWSGAHSPSSIPLSVNCYDYGAIGKVIAGLYTGGGYANAEVRMPLSDGNSNYIAAEAKRAAHWRGWNGNDTDDNEAGPTGNTHNGDGFSAFEEYRGFEVSDKAHTAVTHIRPSPLKKNLFLYLEDRTYDYGWVNKFPSIFKPQHVNLEQIGTLGSRHMNRYACRDFYTFTQKAVRVTFLDHAMAPAGGGGIASGRADPTDNYQRIQGPGRSTVTTVYRKNISNYINGRYPNNPNNPDRIKESVNRVIAHEVAHCLTLPHVGAISSINNWVDFSYDNAKAGYKTQRASNLPPPVTQSIMAPTIQAQQGKNKFNDYHNSQWLMVPINPTNSETSPPFYSTSLPDFNVQFNTSNTPGYVSLQQPPGQLVPVPPVNPNNNPYHNPNDNDDSDDEESDNDNNNNNGNDVPNTNNQPSPTVSSVPRELQAMGGNASVALKWKAPINNGGGLISDYEYAYRTSTETEWGQFISAGATPLNEIITGLTNGRSYAFIVRAKNSAGYSLASNTDTATPTTPKPPTTPRRVEATGKHRHVILQWDVSKSSGTSPISRYEYKYTIRTNPTETDYTDWVSAGNSTECIVPNLTNGTSYTFTMRAVSDAGESPVSNLTSATPNLPAIPPTPPRNLIATAGDGQVTLRWTAPANRGNGTIYAYQYNLDTNNDGTWSGWRSTRNWIFTTANITGLTNDTVYAFKVRAVSTRAKSRESNKAIATPIRHTEPPRAPTLTSVTSQNQSVILRWTAPTETGTADISDYEYQYTTGTLTSNSVFIDWVSTDSTSTTHTIDGLSNSTQYHFQVRAVSEDGKSSASNNYRGRPSAPRPPPNVPSPPPVSPPPVTPPSSPRNLSATAGGGQVTLRWTAPADNGNSAIIRYDYRYTIGTSPLLYGWYSTGSANTSHTVSSLTNDTSYTFHVRAVNSQSGSPISNVVSATPRATPTPLPSSPRNLSATAGDGQVTLNWNVPRTTGNGILDYQYRVDTHNNNTWQAWVSTGSTATTMTIPGLTNNTIHAFKVRGRNSRGTGYSSSVVTATPEATSVGTVPSPPRNLIATAGDNSVTLRWTAPIDVGGSRIIRYDYRMDTNNDGTWGIWRSTGSSNTDKTILNLSNGTSYGFQVRAVNSTGKSRESNTAPATLPTPVSRRVPSPPRNLTATAGDRRITLRWDAPIDDGGGIDDYEYRYDSNNDGIWLTWTSLNRTTNSVTLTGVTNGYEHQIQVRAANSAGKSLASNTVRATPQATVVVRVPLKPTGLTATVNGSSVTLSWTAPNNGGAPITEYRYRMDQGNDGSWDGWVSTGNANTTHTVSQLTEGFTYAFKVRAVNRIGAGLASTTVTAIILVSDTATVPSAPTNFLSAGHNTFVLITWGAPTSDGGAPILRYQYRYRQSGGSWGGWTTHSTGFLLAQVSNLTNDTLYEFEVHAVNRIGAGAASSTTATPTATTVPGTVTNLSADAGNAKVTLSWSPPDNDGGISITDYKYRKRVGSGWQSWVSVGNNTSHTVTGLTNGLSYPHQFQVRAVNSKGDGAISSLVRATPNATTPDRPTSLSASTGTTTGSINLSWSAPSNNGGATITGYKYAYTKRQPNGRWGTWTSYSSTSSTATSYTVTGLESGGYYRFRVRAVNSVGDGSTSRVSDTYAR